MAHGNNYRFRAILLLKNFGLSSLMSFAASLFTVAVASLALEFNRWLLRRAVSFVGVSGL